MDDLTAFITARLDEDEAAAKWASAGPWTLRAGGYVVGGPDDRDGSPAVTVAAQTQQWNGQHVARHDPARVRREVAAKRAMVERYHDAVDTQGEYGVDGSEYVAERMLRCVAAVWSDHPDYKQEWAL